MLAKLLKWFIRVALLGAVLVGLLIALSWHWLNQPMAAQSGTIELARGSSLYSLVDDLHQQQLIQYPKVLVLYARLSGQTNIKFGEYQLTPELTPKELLALLESGEVIYHSISFIEGHTVLETLQRLRQQKAINHRLPVIKNRKETQQLSAILGSEQLNPEGLLFPDTYFFNKGISDEELVRRAYAALENVLVEEWQNKAPDLPYKNAYEALIMASIVERETGVALEREQIAGVFVRRLQKGMRLQTDPTVIYGMGSDYQGNIRRRDLRRPTPYNTYVINGLPPTPIALAGREAIHAALHPGAGSALYFVAKGDGTHYFSSTLKEHINAVKKYQLKRTENYRSSPE